MNATEEKVFALIRDAVRELNAELGYEHLEDVSLDTAIFEGDLALDSLSLVTLIVDIEARVSDAFEKNVSLASEKAMSMRNSPYRTVGSLVDFITGELASTPMVEA